MNTRGAGSFSSPIIISDDDDESIVESRSRLDDSGDSSGGGGFKEATPPNLSSDLEEYVAPQHLHVSSPAAQSVGYSMALRMGFRPGHGLGYELNGRLGPVSVAHKRRCTDSGIGFRGGSEDSEPHLQHEARQAVHKKPKQDHPSNAIQAKPVTSVRQKDVKLAAPERVAAAPSPAFRNPPTTPSPLAPTLPSHRKQELSCISGVVASVAAGHSHVPLLLHQHHNHPVMSFPPFSGLDIQDSWTQPWFAYEAQPSVAWPGFVSSFPDGFANGTENKLPVSCPPVVGPQSSVDELQPQDGTRRASTLSVVSKVPPAKPEVSTIIGRDRGADPQGIHGKYSKPLRSPPNPSCTLVLDAIPLRFRSAAWLATWAANAGRHPAIQVDIDIKKGTGLVEFPHATAAHKAFSSRQLRGKGKHGIRAWWYRISEVTVVTTPEHVSGSHLEEMEEGEIVETPTSEVSFVQISPPREQKKLPNIDHASGQSVNATPVTVTKRMDSSEAGAGSSAASLAPASVITDISPPIFDKNDVDDMDMSPSVSITPDVPQHVVLRPIAEATAHSTEPQQRGTAGPSSIENTPLSTKSAATAKSTTLAPNVPFSRLPPPPFHETPTNHAASRVLSCVPSEPRTSRTPPPGPSYIKRSLLSRQKELENKISMSKLALENMQKIRSAPSAPPTPHSPSFTPTAQTPSEGATDEEQTLRWLVQESKKNRPNHLVASVPPDAPPKSLTSSESATIPSSLTASTLDELAVSFIADSIEAVKQSKIKSVPPNTREELALKHQRLERYIAESKLLMAKLGKASTKGERETILAAMRECSRMMEPDSTSDHENTIVAATHLTVKDKRFRWPSSFEVSFEISDEEE